MLTGSESQSRPEAVPPPSDKPRCSRGCIVVGTDTEVGKTYQSAALARYLRKRTIEPASRLQGVELGVYKPVASGVCCDEQPLLSQSDGWILREAAGVRHPLDRVCPQQFRRPLAPPLAAQAEGKLVNEPMLVHGLQWWMQHCDFLIIEAAGGVLSPISEHWTFLDFLVEAKVDLPVLVVAANRLGVVNHALLTVEAIRRRGFSIEGILLNTLPKPQSAFEDAQTARLTREQRSEQRSGHGTQQRLDEYCGPTGQLRDYSLDTNLALLRQFAPDLRIEANGEAIWSHLYDGLAASRSSS